MANVRVPSDNLPQWREMDDADRARAYSPSSMLDGPLDPFIQAYVEKSAAAYAACTEVQTLRYGDRESNTIDLVVPSSDILVPLHIFIHGGYWQELSKKDSFFPAPEILSRGMAFAVVDYTLCPDATLDEIVTECCAAVSLLEREAAGLNIDSKRIVLSGSSAGAHLAAMCCLTLPLEDQPAGATLISGVFELEPLIGTYINDAVGMDVPTAARNSPALADLSTFPRTVIAWGEHETEEFKRQSRQFAVLLNAAGRPVETIEVANRNHFDIVEDIANDTDLGRRAAALTNT